jgi:hypothetical protein
LIHKIVMAIRNLAIHRIIFHDVHRSD